MYHESDLDDCNCYECLFDLLTEEEKDQMRQDFEEEIGRDLMVCDRDFF